MPYCDRLNDPNDQTKRVDDFSYGTGLPLRSVHSLRDFGGCTRVKRPRRRDAFDGVV